MMMNSTATILVVDDDADIREIMQIILENEGYRVVSAADGAEALVALREGKADPCLILLDLMMPGMNGLEFREEQRRDPRLADIPVVVITGAGTPMRDVAREIAQAILVKPVDMGELLATAKRFCAHECAPA